jgi:hypothetical protein
LSVITWKWLGGKEQFKDPYRPDHSRPR